MRITWAVGLAVVVLAGPAAAQDGKRYAVLVGVNEYDHPKLEALKYAVNDATELASLLGEQGYQVTLLTAAAKDEGLRPVKKNIDAALKSVLDKCRKGDTVVVGMAGHGVQFEGKKDAYFCPADGKPFPDQTDTLVSLAALYTALDQSYAGIKVVLVDACRDDPVGGRGVDADASVRPPRGVACLFSCSAGERSFEHKGFEHGVFFHHVIKGLRGQAADRQGRVTFAGLASYVSTEVARAVPAVIGNGARQSPNLRADYANEPLLARLPRTAVLAIGVNTYANLKSLNRHGLENHLKGPDGDAAWVGGSFRGPNTTVTVMSTVHEAEDRLHPTGANVRAQLKAAFADLSPADTAVVFFAGYELQYRDSDEYYLLPADVDGEDTKTMVTLAEVTDALAASKARSKVVLVDACRGREKLGAKAPKDPPDGVVVLFGCSAGEVAYEYVDKATGRTRGVLARCLGDALRGAADADRDGRVGWNELVKYLTAEVPALSRRLADGVQTPSVFGRTADPAFVVEKK